MTITSISKLEHAICALVERHDPSRAMLIGVSGIDGAGKGWVSTELAGRLRLHGYHVVVLNVDGWLNLPQVRFSPHSPGAHFYYNALRLDEFFARLLEPLQAHRCVDIAADYAEETAHTFRLHRYVYENVDIVLAEGIFLFKAAYRRIFDLTVWVDCSYETALERAIARSQEGLSPQDTTRAFETIYFPAQHLHAHIDAPKVHATYILPNDPN